MKNLLFILILAFALTGCSSPATETPYKLIISVPASLKTVMEELAGMYDESVSMNFASSGDLKAQIQQGAPIDIFISASQQHMDELEKDGLLIEGSRQNFLENALVLIVPSDSEKNITSFSDVASEAITQFAMGEPSSVPAGKYAQEAFDALGIYEIAKEKAVFAKDVRQALTYVEQGEVDAGIVYLTDTKNSQKVTVVDEFSNISIVYPLAVIKSSSHTEKAEDFIQFLLSESAKEIYKKNGFIAK